MKNLLLLFLPLILLGAGCLGGGASSTGSDGGVFKTGNAGEDWIQTVAVPTAAGIGTLATTDVLNMAMDPQDKSYLYIGTRQNGLLYSEDGGTSWRQPREAALKDGLIFRVAVDPKDVCRVYVARGSRLFGTDNCLRSFDSEVYVENRPGVNVVQVEVDWYNTHTLWVGLSNGDVLKSTDAGNTWSTVLSAGDEVSDILISQTDSRQILVSTYKKGIFKTSDAGATWKELDGGLGALKQSGRVYAMMQSQDSTVAIAASQYGLARSRDFGETWEGIPLLTSPGQVAIRAMGMDTENPNTLYYAANATFYRSTDAGATWSTERFPSSRVPRALLVDPRDSGVVYIGVATAIE